MMAVIVDQEKCTGCGTCEETCPVEAIKVEDSKAEVDEETCVDCGTCIEECTEGDQPIRVGVIVRVLVRSNEDGMPYASAGK